MPWRLYLAEQLDHPQLHPFCSFFELLALAFLVEVDLKVWCDPRGSLCSLSAGPVCRRFVLLGKAWSWWAFVEATEAYRMPLGVESGRA